MSHPFRQSDRPAHRETAPLAGEDDPPSATDETTKAVPLETPRGPFDARFALAATFGLWVIVIGLVTVLVAFVG